MTIDLDKLEAEAKETIRTVAMIAPGATADAEMALALIARVRELEAGFAKLRKELGDRQAMISMKDAAFPYVDRQRVILHVVMRDLGLPTCHS